MLLAIRAAVARMSAQPPAELDHMSVLGLRTLRPSPVMRNLLDDRSECRSKVPSSAGISGDEALRDPHSGERLDGLAGVGGGDPANLTLAGEHQRTTLFPIGAHPA
jgi:hypothetical protein